ncbi:DDB1- and CUL4-associated factor 6-like [Drosophila tropicalis]|uniref:DDB1- and CUL4-associated factor 6-like n=1 Tax=Drosophila tropicalis TaxID=46794 RepID=UPI0035AB684C
MNNNSSNRSHKTHNLRRSVHQSLEYYPYYSSRNGGQAQANLQASCRNSLDFVQRMDLMQTMDVHNGCVNTVNWNANGTHIVSGSDDNCLVITEAKTSRVILKSRTQHKRHIFSARFMPHCNDQAVISCSGEGLVLHTEFLTPYSQRQRSQDVLIFEEDQRTSVFDCHKFGSTFDVLPLVDAPRSFLSCGEDSTVRCFDLNVSSRCTELVCHKHIYIMAPCAVTAMDVAPINTHLLAIGCSDSIVRIYDRRKMSPGHDSSGANETQPLKAYPIPLSFTRRHYRPTCVKFNSDESELLVSYSMEQLYLFDLKHPGFEDAGLLRSGCYTGKMRRDDDPEPQIPRLRFRGDWSDTGPNSLAMTEQGSNRPNVGQARPPLEPGVLSRLSDEIFRMLNSNSRQGRSSTNPHEAAISNTNRTRPMRWQNAVLRTMEQGNHENTSMPMPMTMPSTDNQSPCCEPEIADVSAPARSDDVTSTSSSKSESCMEAVSDVGGQKYPLTSFDYVKMSFCGHRNSRTMVKGACFWGDDFIMSGSDCGHIFVWQRETGKVVKTLLADNRVVNRVQPHPTLPYLLSSGIDYNIKLWAPIAAEPAYDDLVTTALMKNNGIMLVETRDTITVPAQVMIRILASLHQYRRLMHNNTGSSSGSGTSAAAAPAEASSAAETSTEENNTSDSNPNAEIG